MYKILRESFLLGTTLVLGLVLFCTHSPVGAATIVVAADVWFPYTGDPHSERPGYIIEILRKVAVKNGHQIDYRLMKWSDAKRIAYEGGLDCIVGSVRGDAPEFVFPTEPFGKTTTSAYRLKTRPITISRLSDLRQYRLGVVQGYSYSSKIDTVLQAMSPTQLITVNSMVNPIQVSMQNLLDGKIDLLIDDELVAENAIRSMQLSKKVVKTATLSLADNVYTACSPNRPASRIFTNQLSDGVRALRRSGDLEKILAAYGLKDWQVPAKTTN